MRSNEVKKGQILIFLLKTHVSYAVLSQDFNGVICFGVRCSEPPKIAIENFDVMTLHT